MKDRVLIAWLITDLISDIFLIAGSIYLVIWKGCSGWWIVLAIVLAEQPDLYKALRKRYNIEVEE